MIVSQRDRRGRTRILWRGDDHELGRIVYALRARAARAGTTTMLATDDGATLATEVSERAHAFHVAGRRERTLF